MISMIIQNSLGIRFASLVITNPLLCRNFSICRFAAGSAIGSVSGPQAPSNSLTMPAKRKKASADEEVGIIDDEGQPSSGATGPSKSRALPFSSAKSGVDGSGKRGRGRKNAAGATAAASAGQHATASQPADASASSSSSSRTKKKQKASAGSSSSAHHQIEKTDGPPPGYENVDSRASLQRNAEIARYLFELAEQEGAGEARNPWKILAYQRAADAISACSWAIQSGKQAMSIKGVGKGIAAKIDEILTTGTLQKWADQNADPRLHSLLELQRVHGIGPAKASELYDVYGITDLAALGDRLDLLDHAQRVGFRYIDELEVRIPREEIQVQERVIHDAARSIDPKIQVTVCGSYRREKATCGDIDVLITHPLVIAPDATKPAKVTGPSHLLSHLVRRLESQGVITDRLGLGPTKFMGICVAAATADESHHGQQQDQQQRFGESAGAAGAMTTSAGGDAGHGRSVDTGSLDVVGGAVDLPVASPPPPGGSHTPPRHHGDTDTSGIGTTESGGDDDSSVGHGAARKRQRMRSSSADGGGSRGSRSTNRGCKPRPAGLLSTKAVSDDIVDKASSNASGAASSSVSAATGDGAGGGRNSGASGTGNISSGGGGGGGRATQSTLDAFLASIHIPTVDEVDRHEEEIAREAQEMMRAPVPPGAVKLDGDSKPPVAAPAADTASSAAAGVQGKQRPLHRHIDIRLIPSNCYPTAILHFTGSGPFNQRMRAIARSKGYSLNEYALRPIVARSLRGGAHDHNADSASAAAKASAASAGVGQTCPFAAVTAAQTNDASWLAGADVEDAGTSTAAASAPGSSSTVAGASATVGAAVAEDQLGPPVPVSSEADIFAAIGMDYVEPKDRVA